MNATKAFDIDATTAQLGDAMADPEAGMQRWQEACAAGDAHKLLERFLGSWKTKTTMMHGCGGEGGEGPPPSEGTSEIRWLHEGRWMMEEVKGEMMGRPFTRTIITGFDNFKKKYVVSAVDSTSTALVSGVGNFDREGKVLTWFVEMDEPMTGEHDKPVRIVTTIRDDDHFTTDIQEVLYGEPFSVLKVEYERA